MILKELKQLAEREHLLADEAYGPQKIHYLISIDSEGGVLGIVDTFEPPASGKGKPQPKQFSTPSPIGRRTRGPRANFLYDKADYVFGVGSADSSDLKTRKDLFRSEIDEALQATHDRGLQAVRAFLERIDRDPAALRVPQDVAGAVFAFRDIDDPTRLISDRRPVREYWRAKRSESGDTGTCMICGERTVLARTHPEIKNVPGGNSAGVAIVSFNRSAQWSYGFAADHAYLNAPFCRSCADGYTRALNRLLAPAPGFPHPLKPGQHLPVQNERLSADTVVVYWSTDEEFAGLFGKLLHGNAESVRSLFRSPFAGRPVEMETAHFFAMIISGAQGRAVVRSTIHSTVGEVSESLVAHFNDLALVPQYRDEPEVYGLQDLVASLKPPGRETVVVAARTQEMFEAAVLGRPYSLELLNASIRRLRAGEPFSHQRLSTIKAVLNRRRRTIGASYKEILMALDHENIDPGYRLGRLFAVLERLQGEAINNPNATIVDRFYGAASTTPVVVFPRLLNMAQHHASKSNRGNFFQKLIEDISSGLQPDSAFPSTLALDQQGLFALGYYHQRADLWKKRDAETPPTDGEETSND
jgi:CRISPR-associated protein Csd1